MSGADTPERAGACTRDTGAMRAACSGAQAQQLVTSCLGSVSGGAWTDVRNETCKHERRKMPEKEWGEEENEARLVKRVENSRRKKSKNWP